jgi:HEAT repeats
MSSGHGHTLSRRFGAGEGEAEGDKRLDDLAGAPSPFRGSLGATRSRAVRVRSGDTLISVEVYVSIDADADAELGRRARGELTAPLHALMVAGEAIELAVPFLYHEPSRALFALVVPPALRHRELDERIELYRQLQAEPADVPIPEYVLRAEVVIGPDGLRALRGRGGKGQAMQPEAPRLPSALTALSSASAISGSGSSGPSAIPTATTDDATVDATVATVAPPGEAGEEGEGSALDGSVDRAIDAAMDADLAFEAPAGGRVERPEARPFSGPSAGTIDRPIEVASDAVAMRVAELSAWQRTLEVRTAELEQRTGALARRESALQDRQRRTQARERAASATGFAAAEPNASDTNDGSDASDVRDAGDVRDVRDGASPRSATIAGPVPVAIAVSAPVRPGFFPTITTPTSHLLGVPGIHAGPASGPLTVPGEAALEPSAPTSHSQTSGTSGPSGPSIPRTISASYSPSAISDASGTPDTIDEDLSAGLSRASRELPPGSDPITTEARDQPVYEPDEWLAQVIDNGVCDLTIEHGRARVALAATAIDDVDVLRGPLDVRVVLRRAAAYPVVVLLVGSPGGLRGDRRDQLAAMCLDVAAERDRAVLSQLARSFEIVLEIFADGRWIRRVLISAPLADNVAYVLRAADDSLHRLAEHSSNAELEDSADRAFAEVAAPGYDITGALHPDADAFRDSQLIAVRTAGQLGHALVMAQRFARPEGEDYLVCVRGFPLLRWRRLRRHVLEQAVTWGIWMGAELARVAVSEGLARSRRDLVHKLHDGFELLQRHPSACDLDEVALAENADALALEARTLGVTPGKARTLFDSEMDSVIAGTIELVPSGPVLPVSAQTLSELVAALEDLEDRLAAALELCRRGADVAARPLIAAVTKMSRLEAVQVLACAFRLGPPVEEPLIAALGSSKAYVRQGAALALGLLRSDEGVAAVVTLLLTEPTEIWKEVARALGQVGPQALHHLARTVRDEGSTAIVEERVAWALAHLGARDCHKAIVQMSSGHSIMAPIAAKALLLVEPAARDQQALVSDDAAAEVTVNRTFSRQFFAAIAGAVVAGAASDEGSQVITLGDKARGQRREASESD